MPAATRSPRSTGRCTAIRPPGPFP
jgi:hypothetical protein